MSTFFKTNLFLNSFYTGVFLHIRENFYHTNIGIFLQLLRKFHLLLN